MSSTSFEILTKMHVRLSLVVREVALAVEDCVGAERTYLYSLGSQQGNAHPHWHIAGLPPAVPYERQQFHALMAENGVLAMSHEESSAVAGRIRESVAARQGLRG
ncbi:hypothetical protein [Streptomyces sp. NPDC059224]|uniref:hypothetical protein n=1 Tax=Streptomyces sp. NPDC059224 TaxID=3346775 RepID=UPI0036BE4F37